MLDEFFSEYEFGAFSALDVTLNLLVALGLSLAVTVVYRKTHSGLSYSRSFNVTLIAVTMTITMIMMIIGNYWVLSLGLVGALSVIRFRSAIKDPKDIAYLFLCIAIGLACSTGNYIISVLGTAIIGGTLYALHLLRFGGPAQSGYCLTVCLDESKTTAIALLELLSAIHVEAQFRSYARLSDQLGEYVYTLDLGDNAESDLIAKLNAELPGITNVSLLAPESIVEL